MDCWQAGGVNVIVDINGQAVVHDPGARTVADLLRDVDGRVARQGEVVTAVRLDGVDEPDFRAPGVAARRLDDHREVSFDSDTPKGLARRTLGEAALALEDLLRATQTAADGFRADDIRPAKAMLEQVSQGLLGVVQIVALAQLALRGELDAAGSGEGSLATLSVNLDRIVGSLTDTQKDEDWVQVADILQYELAPALASWQSVLGAVAAA
jgi:hypothetical protein